MVKLQKNCEKNINEAKFIYGNINQMENNNKEMYAKIEQKNKKMCEELKETLNTNVKVTYAEAVQKVLPKKNNLTICEA